MWDEIVDFILSSKYDPLDKGTGEAGLRDDGDASISEITVMSKSSKISRRQAMTSMSPSESMASMVKEVITAVMVKEEPKRKKKKSKKKIILKWRNNRCKT